MLDITDRKIGVTRGDMLPLTVSTLNKDGTPYKFKKGDIIRFKVFKKKEVKVVYLKKDFTVSEDTEAVDIDLTSEDTRIGELINAPTEYWYEIEVNPDTLYTNTIIGYEEDKGPAIFLLLPEGGDKE